MSQTHRPDARNRAQARLTHKLENRLLTYASAASAAGVGLLAAALPAQGKVVYTPSNIPIVGGQGLTQLDLNKDGIPDFGFSNYSYQTHGNGQAFLKAVPDQSANQILGVTSRGKLAAAALPRGYRVGPKGAFQSDPKGLYLDKVEFGSSGGSYYGPWHSVETAYLGLKFVVNGQVHYGWARIKFAAPGFFETASIAGYAYETVANRGLVTGVRKGPAKRRGTPVNLGLLARGAAGLAVRRDALRGQ